MLYRGLVAADINDYAWLREEITNNPLEKAEKAISETGGSFLSMLITLAAIVGVCTLIMAGIYLVMAKSGRMTEEAKERIKYIAIGVAIAFGAVTIVGWAVAAGTALDISGRA